MPARGRPIIMSANRFTQVINASLLKPEMVAELDKFRRDVTVMFTDIKGSTAYFEKYGDIAGVMMVHQCTELLKKEIAEHNGTFIKTIGDAVMAMFEDCTSAVQTAIAMHMSLKHYNANRPEQDQIRIRIGLNYGNGIVRSNDVFGDVVNVASRVESVAQPDQIVISQSVNQRIAPLDMFKLEYLGRFALKGKEGPSDLFEVLWDETREAKPMASHTVMAAGGAGLQMPKFKLQHMVPGAQGREWELPRGQFTIGQARGDVTFPDDPRMAPVHARLTSDLGQVIVEDISDWGIFIRLVATYTLQDGDIILVGTQMLKFSENAEAVHAAASTGTSMMKLSAMLNAAPAELIAIGPDGEPSGKHYAITQDDVTFGRSGATYSFPDDEFMSRTHAKVYHRGENFFVEDCSRNGTFLKVRGKAPLPPGSTMIVGSQMFQVAQL